MERDDTHIVACTDKEQADAMEALLKQATVEYQRLYSSPWFIVQCSDEQAQHWRDAGYRVVKDFELKQV